MHTDTQKKKQNKPQASHAQCSEAMTKTLVHDERALVCVCVCVCVRARARVCACDQKKGKKMQRQHLQIVNGIWVQALIFFIEHGVEHCCRVVIHSPEVRNVHLQVRNSRSQLQGTR